MKKVILPVLLCSFLAYALNDYSTPNDFTNGATIYAADFTENNDSDKVWKNALNDSLDQKFVRFKDFERGDSTLSRFQADTANIETLHVDRLEPDTLKGRPFADTLDVGYVNVLDSVKITGHLKVTQDVRTDSLIATTGAVVGHDLVADSLLANGMRSYGDLTADSVIGVTGMRSAGTASVDSLFSTKGIKATTATLSGAATVGGTVSADSVFSTKGIKATTATLSGAATVGGTASVDSLFSTKGVLCSQINTGEGLTEVYAMDQNLRITDSPTFATLEVDGVTIGINTLTTTEWTNLDGQDQAVKTTSDVIFDSIAVTDDITVAGDIYTVDWTDYFSTSTKTGWADTPTGNIWYKVIGDIVYVNFYVTGTSNSTGTGFTIPYAPSFASEIACMGVDNGSLLASPPCVVLSASNATVSIGSDFATPAGWTNSGTKTVRGQFFYKK